MLITGNKQNSDPKAVVVIDWIKMYSDGSVGLQMFCEHDIIA